MQKIMQIVFITTFWNDEIENVYQSNNISTHQFALHNLGIRHMTLTFFLFHIIFDFATSHRIIILDYFASLHFNTNFSEHSESQCTMFECVTCTKRFVTFSLLMMHRFECIDFLRVTLEHQI